MVVTLSLSKCGNHFKYFVLDSLLGVLVVGPPDFFREDFFMGPAAGTLLNFSCVAHLYDITLLGFYLSVCKHYPNSIC
jgi:hypothetical protein